MTQAVILDIKVNLCIKILVSGDHFVSLRSKKGFQLAQISSEFS